MSFSRSKDGLGIDELDEAGAVDISEGLVVARLTPAFANAANDPDPFVGDTALNDAWAVFADIEDVGGLETRIDLIGDSKVACRGGGSIEDIACSWLAEAGRHCC